MKNIIKHKQLKSEVLKWLDSMQTGPVNYKMNEGADDTIFTTCIALFIYDLFNEVTNWSVTKKNKWIDYIRSFQDQESGYFIPRHSNWESNVKTIPQLTTFCLSALSILDADPQYNLFFLNQWKTPKDVDKYLKDIGSYNGKPGSGNLSMFQAIFLTWDYEKNKSNKTFEKLEYWFNKHNQFQNSDSGFWGNYSKKFYHASYQNAFHQFVIYNYWNKNIKYSQRIIDIVLSLQDSDGHFGILPGGSGCGDLDATDILIQLGIKKNYKRKIIEQALSRLAKVILKDQNKDNGFCESKKIPSSIFELLYLRNIRFIFLYSEIYLMIIRFKSLVSVSRAKKQKIVLQWTEEGRYKDQSNLWDTWFRCLALAQIDTILNNRPDRNSPWNFQKFIGLGYFTL